jgi:hypothetical protein
MVAGKDDGVEVRDFALERATENGENAEDADSDCEWEVDDG